MYERVVGFRIWYIIKIIIMHECNYSYAFNVRLEL